MKTLLTTFAFAVVSLGLLTSESARAQNAILAEMYGRGVHAYYAGNSNDAMQYLSMAINNGIQDPRAYYFRGIAAYASGRPYEAESDWQTGAEMEASGRTNPSIGRSLARFQGAGRLKLEEIRQKARLQALATANARSQMRYGEIEAAGATPSPGASAGAAPPPPTAQPPAKVTPPPIPPAAENPFADDMAAGQPEVASDDAFKGAMTDPFAGDDSAGADQPPADGTDPFGGGAGGDTNPFGDDSGAADPFGGDAGGAMDDPFGGAGDAGADDDPFGGNPFGS